jgi:ABC-type nickel/cobalt efflux system permease component RcnA
LSQNLYYAGIFGAIAIGIGTAVTTSAIAVFAILLKQAATKLIEKRDTIYASLIITILEALAAAFVFILGASLLLASLSTRFETG